MRWKQKEKLEQREQELKKKKKYAKPAPVDWSTIKFAIDKTEDELKKKLFKTKIPQTKLRHVPYVVPTEEQPCECSKEIKAEAAGKCLWDKLEDKGKHSKSLLQTYFGCGVAANGYFKFFDHTGLDA